MKKQIILLFYLFTILVCNAQNDTAKIYNSSVLKKGFYKNYDEYINNSPSVTPDFTTILLSIKNMTDTIITGAKYKINDGTTVSGSWGFCDGTDVFINKRISLFKRRYLKAQYIGKNPFFLFWHRDVYAIGPPLVAIITAAASATKPASFDLMFINPAGKVKIASYKNLKKLFVADPDVLKRFKTERAFTDKIKTEYLVEFNEKFITESTERMQ
jgi:hypothetical protein